MNLRTERIVRTANENELFRTHTFNTADFVRTSVFLHYEKQIFEAANARIEATAFFTDIVMNLGNLSLIKRLMRQFHLQWR